MTWFAGGFRPFFLASGLSALAPLAWWMAHQAGLVSVPTNWVPMFWHAHEMLFGFVTAAIAGFLLTAVPKWTNTRAVSGGRLGVVFAAWVLGRVAMAASGVLPAPLVAAADLLLLPVLGIWVVPPIFARGAARNYGFPLVLLVLWLADLIVHLERIGIDTIPSRAGLQLGIHAVALLLILLGGRLVPNFTRNTLRRLDDAVEVRELPGIEPIVYLCAISTAISTTFSAPSWLTGSAALATSLALLLRSARWRARRCLRQPILWALHAGHAWLVVAYVMLGLSGLSDLVPESAAIHAFTVGAMGTMILAVMTRASLGHSGRKLEVAPAITLAYVLVILAGLLRVGLSIARVEALPNSLVAGIPWCAAFAIFCAVYGPILMRPRIDGRPG
jgi:uncharacterized protein involved in response to NO